MLCLTMTEGAGTSYALLHNQERPLKMKTYVSHTWGEPIKEFDEAIKRSGEEGPFYICAFSIYQNSILSKGVTITEQLGSDPKFGVFATVLKISESMLVIPTNGCNMFTRLWCVYDTFFANHNGVRV